MLIDRIIQTQSEWGMEELEACLPEPIKTLQALPIPFEFVYDHLANTEKAVKERQKEIGGQLAKDFPNYTQGEDTEEDDVSIIQVTTTACTHDRQIQFYC